MSDRPPFSKRNVTTLGDITAHVPRDAGQFFRFYHKPEVEGHRSRATERRIPSVIQIPNDACGESSESRPEDSPHLSHR
jgi:hypothetical protein